MYTVYTVQSTVHSLYTHFVLYCIEMIMDLIAESARDNRIIRNDGYFNGTFEVEKY